MNRLIDEKIFCERCERELKPKQVVWLELRMGTDEWGLPGWLEPEDSQGVFSFGKSCAKSQLEATNE